MRARLGVVLSAGVALAGCGAAGAATARGPVARPAPSVDVGTLVVDAAAGAGDPTGAAAAALTARAAVEQVVTFNADWLEDCYTEALRAYAQEGKLTFSWDVQANGEAARVRLDGSTMTPSAAAGPLAACVATQISRWRFPPQVRGRGVTYTFTFRRWWTHAAATQPRRRSRALRLDDLPERAWEYDVGRRAHREPDAGPPARGELAAAGSMPAPPTSHPVRGTVTWAGPVARPRSCVPDGAVRERLIQTLAPIQRCYERELTRHPRLDGHLLLGATIARDGTTSATLRRSTLGADGGPLIGCVLKVVGGWRFTPRRGCDGVTVTAFPVHFRRP